MASLSRIASTPDLTEQVYQRLLYAICDGELSPRRAAHAGGPGRNARRLTQPVLQALRLLKKESFVSDAGRRGLGSPLEGRTRSPRCTRCGPSSTASPPAVPRRPMPRWTPRSSRRASGCCRAAHRVDDRRGHAVSPPSTRPRESARCRDRQPSLAPYPPRHGGGAANRRPAPSCVGRA